MELDPLTPSDPARPDSGAPSLPGLADASVLEHRLASALRAIRAVGSSRSVGLLRVQAEPGRVADLAVRLRDAVRPGDTVAVVGPGTFCVLCDRLGDPDDLLSIAQRVEDALTRPQDLSPTIDVSVADPSRRDASGLVGRSAAPVATAGDGDLVAGQWWRFDDGLHRRAAERQQAEAALRATSDGRDLVLEYQPELDLGTGRPAGVEALVRWRRDGRTVPPDAFIPLAERTGLIVPIGAWVLHAACEQLARWRAGGSAIGMSMAVNVSPRQLLHDDVVDVVTAAMSDSGLGAGDLVLELTESVLLADLELAGERLAQLRSLGARIAVDDFGTGYASLTYLHRLPVDAVKLDRSFVDGLGTDDRLTAIVTSVLGLLDSLGLESIAEGVSSAAQADRLRELGCRLAQGSWVGRPTPGDELFDHLR